MRGRHDRLWAAVFTLLAAAQPAFAADAEATARRHGWGYLVDKLAADGVPRARAAKAFADPRVPPFDGLGFSLAPREAAGPYRRLQSAASIRAARRCRERYAAAFAAAEAREGVPASLIASIIHVESSCGHNTGGSRVFHRLARLAMANEPANVAWNIRRHTTGSAREGTIGVKVRNRARYLEDTFYPEVRGLFTIADRQGIDPLAMRGSPSGAFGFPQFLPTSYLRHGVDGNGDGRISLYDMADAAASCARYLAHHGWRGDLDADARRAVIWHYNRSPIYVDTILALDRHLGGGGSSKPQMARESRGDVGRQ
jgi:membrane-bound lytic murein transglycosylase B